MLSASPACHDTYFRIPSYEFPCVTHTCFLSSPDLNANNTAPFVERSALASISGFLASSVVRSTASTVGRAAAVPALPSATVASLARWLGGVYPAADLPAQPRPACVSQCTHALDRTLVLRQSFAGTRPTCSCQSTRLLLLLPAGVAVNMSQRSGRHCGGHDRRGRAPSSPPWPSADLCLLLSSCLLKI